MRQQPYRRATIILRSGRCDHLHIVCNDPIHCPRFGREGVLLVNVTSIDPLVPHDSTCVLNVGDHPFIQHPSYIFYRRAEVHGVLTVANKIADNEYRYGHDIADHVFQRVLQGFRQSTAVPLKILRFVEHYC